MTTDSIAATLADIPDAQPTWNVILEPGEPYADKTITTIRAIDEDALVAAITTQYGTNRPYWYHIVECSCPDEPVQPCLVTGDEHFCICTLRFADHPEPLCRLHGLEDVTNGCFDVNAKRRTQILRALI